MWIDGWTGRFKDQKTATESVYLYTLKNNLLKLILFFLKLCFTSVWYSVIIELNLHNSCNEYYIILSIYKFFFTQNSLDFVFKWIAIFFSMTLTEIQKKPHIYFLIVIFFSSGLISLKHFAQKTGQFCFIMTKIQIRVNQDNIYEKFIMWC